MSREKTQFKPGNQGGGRPPGSKNKISEDFLQTFHKVWEEKGEAALRRMVDERPAEFIKVAASLIPKDFHIQQSAAETPKISIAIDPNSGLGKSLLASGSAELENPNPG